ncbi:MAG: Transcription-repair-coupling factor [Bacteroidia bacterium]|nr:Transcription-repair-coupling factor [Bacteroidia bacterium]
MDLEAVKNSFSQHPRIAELVNSLSAGNTTRIHIKNLAGSSSAFAAATVVLQIPKTHVFILPGKEEAAYFLNDIENFLPSPEGEGSGVRALFFPMSYRRPYSEEEQTDNSNVVERAETLNKLNQNFARAVVTYPEALSEKVVTRKVLEKNTLLLKTGDTHGIDFITDILFEYHFERVDYVFQPGQFAVRGGIVDMFSFSGEYPLRVEFFGNTIESIRSFDPSTQLSVATHAKATILPNVQQSLLHESRVSFLEFIPVESVVWITDVRSVTSVLDKELESAKEAYAALSLGEGPGVRLLPPEEKYISGNYFIEKFNQHSVVEFGQAEYFDDVKTIEFNTSPQPAFNKNFEMLGEHLRKNTAAGFQNLLAAENPKQAERLYSIFEDMPVKAGEKKPEFTPLVVSVSEGFTDHDLKICFYTDHQIFERYHRFRLRTGFKKTKEALTLKELHGLNPGDYVTHIDHGIGKFAGLEKIDVNGKMQEAVRLVYRDNDILYVSIHSLHRIAKYSGKDGAEPKINKLGSAAWQALKLKTKSKVKDIAKDLIKLYAQRRAKKGFEFSQDNYLQTELEASFIYEDTPDQIKATADVKKDMEQNFPMDRLICGDVGFGKTEIAIRAAFKAVCDSKQVAVLVPTTILALQHYKTFSERLKNFPCRVDYINRFITAGQQKETLKKLEKGEIDIIIGTHRIVSKDVKFKDLGLLIVDEEQKFGVGVKEKLKAFRVNVDTLTLTATPIPRTLQFSLMGARDLSIINTPPPNRFPVITEVHTFNEATIRDAIRYEIDRGGQVFFVNNRVENIREVAGMISRLCPDVRVGIGHGQLEGHQLEDVMMKFIEGETDVLIATTIIESGLDISNANTIIINNAQYFGLSDLHQMRGRVGRSNKKAFCYLLAPPSEMLSTEAKKRLRAIEEFSELGSGFNIAMRDLDIRGAGNLLGAEQSGFISDIGFEMYHKILDEALTELRIENEELRIENENNIRQKHSASLIPNSAFVKDCVIDTDMAILIPDDYVNNITDRLGLYRELDDTENENELIVFEKNLIDRFGPLPKEATELLNTIRLRWIAKEIGFERLILKNKKLTGYFISSPNSLYFQSDTFGKVLNYVQTHGKDCRMTQKGDKLTLSFENVVTIGDAIKWLKAILVVS